MDIIDFLQPVNKDLAALTGKLPRNSLYTFSSIFRESGNLPDPEGCEIALIGVPEDRGSEGNAGCAGAPDVIRKKLYRLNCGDFTPKICDLGNIRKGQNLQDTYAALQVVCGELLRQKIVPVIIGGSQDITYAQYLSYKNLKKTVNIVSVDAYFNLGISSEKKMTSDNYVGKIILHQPNFLFNFSNIGFQTHFVGKDSVQLMEKLFFDAYRLGQVRKNLEEVEPVIRNADIFSFDVTSVRSSDAPGNRNATPNGFFGEEACQISRYAGLCENVSSAGFYETNPGADRNDQTSFLTAQMIWYFIDGFYNRKQEGPFESKTGFKKYRVAIKDSEHEIVFYKSKKSDRWWMEVPHNENRSKLVQHHVLPCSYTDYEASTREEIPERWWLAFQKLNK